MKFAKWKQVFTRTKVISFVTASILLGGGILTTNPAHAAGGTALSRTGWTASASVTQSNGSAASVVLDGNTTTIWSTGTALTSSQWFTVDMGAAKTFDRIVLDSGTSSNYIRGYSLYVSSDGTNWGNPVVSGVGNGQMIDIRFPSQTKQFVKIQSTEGNGATSNPWKIAELNAYTGSTEAEVTYNFATEVNQGSPYVFGGTGNDQTDAGVIAALKGKGFNLTRLDAQMIGIVPSKLPGTTTATTVANYKAAMADSATGDVADPSTWNWEDSGLESKLNAYDSAGYKIMLVFAYTSPWLSYSGAKTGVPMDLDVYQDIITKIYQHFASKVDYWEVWNEPDNDSVFSLSGSPYTDRILAYRDMYYAAASGIRSVSATAPIGGPALASSYWTGWVDSMFNDSRIANDVNFISFHNYALNETEPVLNWKTYLANKGKSSIPLFMDEWNVQGKISLITPMDNMDDSAISFTGKRLIDNYKNGIFSTSLYSLGEGLNFGFWYTTFDGQLASKTRTWDVLANRIGLGTGQGSVKQTVSQVGIRSGMAVTNAAGEKVVAFSNPESFSRDVAVTIQNTGISGTSAYLEIYEASDSYTGASVKQYQTVNVSGGTISTTVNVPDNAVVAFKIKTGTAPAQPPAYVSPLPNAGLLDRSTWMASGGTGTATVNSTAKNAIDKYLDTRWTPGVAQSAGNFYQIDLGAVTTFDRLVMKSYGTGYAHGFSVYVSNDGSNWGSAIATGGSSNVIVNGNQANHDLTLPLQNARYVKVVLTTGYSGWWSLHDFELYHNLAKSASASASNAASGFPASNVIDGDNSTAWVSVNNAPTPHYITLTWPSGKSFSSLGLMTHNALGQGPTNWNIEVSDDGSTNWTSVASSGTVTWQYNTSTRELRTVSFAAVTNKKGVRVKINAWNNQWLHDAVDELIVR
ncbi:discoidin domain-containing protein [Paenibacillus roseipurpureus]|uniref:Discoidin domain-containing protein n=1 Tax=Paenibacillus roseopurpureus TaxID=2918901 RepID=A0AA96LQ69_9BACL|nr:discoidin domain-containing protein [Paenibacillus sp. MBLB1832]WNR45271.1 discoidin domain-containing protein [Paenibacillus sp. MBLB1832]